MADMGYQQRQLPAMTRLRNRIVGNKNTRESLDFEWSGGYNHENREIELKMYAERVPSTIDLWFATTEPLHVDRLAYSRGDVIEPMQFGVETFLQDTEMLLRVTPARRVPTSRVGVRFKQTLPDVRSRAVFRVVERGETDLTIVRDAHNRAYNDLPAAIELLRTYEKYSTSNPVVSSWLSEWYQQTNDFKMAEHYALNAVANGNVEVAAERYRAVQRARTPRDVKEIRQLQEQAQQWALADHHGLVVIDRKEQFELGLGKYHVRKCSRVIEIRRPAAARMLNVLSFPFSTAREFPLFTRLRVIHPDGSTEQVPDEHFTIGDDEERNILITVDDEKVGYWILPDLVSGDLIEWSYHLLCIDTTVNAEPHPFILAGIFDGGMPTYSGQVEFVANAKQPTRYVVRNSEIEGAHSAVDGREVAVFHGERFVPARRTGHRYENNDLNPLVICCSSEVGWTDVVGDVRKKLVGESEQEDRLPEPLASLVDGADDPALALEKAFYWIRDTLKYATTQSGVRNITLTDRGRKIVESGVGNCNDKSYLLSLVCEHLGLAHDFLGISMKNGILVEEAPADQFDHVFVRAKTDDGWVYLDAANTSSIFGSAPDWCQGMQALAVDGEGTVITIPTDSPGANTIDISEVLRDYRDGWAQGNFEFKLRGHPARLVDERWKVMSLELVDGEQSGQEALRNFLHSSVVVSHNKEADTAASSVFHASGTHSRGPLVHLGKDGKVIGRLAWGIPFLPLGYWRALQMDRLFVMQFPLTVRLEIRLEGELYRSFQDASRIRPLDNPVCGIDEEVVNDGSALRITRKIELRKKHLRGQEVSLLPQALERIEEALQLVISLEHAE